MNMLAGPWVGEFGWELFRWQGVLRRLSREYHGAEIVVASRPGHEILYKDFCTKYITHNIAGQNTSFWRCYDCREGDFKSKHLKLGYAHITPKNVYRGKHGLDQEFIKYGKYIKNMKFDLVYHARSSTKLGSKHRNWSIENWRKLFAHFPGISIASIGTPEESYWIPGTKDFRGKPLEMIVDLLASSRLLVGPSSGPMHLGSLCGIPHVVWSDGKKWRYSNKDRYEKYWNPFATKVQILETQNWQPSVFAVLDAIERIDE